MKKKVMMIIGATKGLGRALAWHYAKKGYDLAITARTDSDLTALKRELEKTGNHVVALAGDMSNSDDVERFVGVVFSIYRKVDVLINNASIFGPGPELLLDYPNEVFKEVLLTNTLIPYLVTKQVLPGMLMEGEGIVITLTSEAGQTGFSGWGAYGISKFAVEGLVQTWANECADTGVRFHLVDPGEMDTEMHNLAVPDCDYELDAPVQRLDVFDFLLETSAINGSREEAIVYQQRGEN
ncbi:SDR family NAD(P)-dependent oxidoreductase [Shouchella patagoniensis]|uniref:SDR family NAD(P)-dependent oxidoreductase n=1 Tax=Shouchella patagoniensis TaxID=228576 RepID=UPI000994A6B2|nr:SDR family oxidoreductase [Shouchella patagoniensis]